MGNLFVERLLEIHIHLLSIYPDTEERVLSGRALIKPVSVHAEWITLNAGEGPLSPSFLPPPRGSPNK